MQTPFDYSIVPKEFLVDNERQVFTKVCDVEQSAIAFLKSYANSQETKMKLAYLATPVKKYHDVAREMCALSIAQSLKRNYVCDSIVSIVSWEADEETEKCDLSLQLASLGNLYEYCELDSDLHTSYIMHESIDGKPEVKYSFIIRLLFTAYALNFIADISHNDLGTRNILMETCEYAFVLICFHNGTKLESILVPSFGVKLIVCDFGMSSRFTTAENQWSDYDFIMHCFEGQELGKHHDEKCPTHKIPSVIINTALYYHDKLSQLEPSYASTASRYNTYVWDMTFEANEDKACACCIS